MNADEILKTAAAIPSWTHEPERLKLISLCQNVPAGGLIVEIGTLYGGTTAVMALSRPDCRVIAVDEFSWNPIIGWKVGKTPLLERLSAIGVSNVEVRDQDSATVGRAWGPVPIDLLWVDGAHHYEAVLADLENFGCHANVIALHDYGNPAWPDVKQAIEEFCRRHPEAKFVEVVDSVAVIEWRP